MIVDVMESPVGRLSLVSDGLGLSGVYFASHKGKPAQTEPAGQNAATRAARAALKRYFSGAPAGFEGKLSLHGTPFQMVVWRALQDIPHGQTTTYASLARAIDRPNANRAVGAAVGANPVSILIPCHRVIGANGALTGFAGGLERKQKLLALEGLSLFP
jgi:methylated-DNA-[protein]-cysteine S-methyltransferase